MEKKLKAAQHKKKVALENIKSLERFVTTFSKDEVGQLPGALERLQQQKEDFFAAMAKLEELDDSSEALESCISDRIDMEERCQRLKAFLRTNLPKETPDSSMLANSTMAFGRPTATNLRLPKIELPTFDGDSTKWLSFRDRFVSMIDDSAELSSIAKLQYLLSSLKGDAALPFEHTPLTNENYAVTWKALLKRYDNTRSLIREYWRKLHFLPVVKSESVEDLTNLVDEFTRHLNGLAKLKEPVEAWDTPLSNMLLMKFDSETILAWEKHSVHFERDKYQELMKFVEDRIQILKSTKSLTIVEDSTIKVAGNARQNTSRRAITNTAAIHKSSGQPRCLLECAENHSLRMCPIFNGKDVQQRRDIVAKKRCCWNCLSNTHLAKDCKSDRSCRTCGERHHSLLHISSTISMGVNSEDETVFLETAVLHLVDDYGTRHEARALLDSGSMSNFISEAFARKLMASRSKVNVSISGIGMASQLVNGSIVATVQSKIQPFATQMEFLILNNPSADIPTTPTDVSSWRMPVDAVLADPSFYIPGRIDIVIGGDAFWEIHSGRKRSLGKGRPWLVETPFGWVVAGNTAQAAKEVPRICHVATSNTPLEVILNRFWECETLPNEATFSAEEDLCEKHYVSTTTRDAAGRYVVSLPFNSNANTILGASKEIADRRWAGMERRLNSNPQMKEAYIKFMKDYERLGHMKKLSEPVDDSVPHYYLPHHAVVKETSTTTKVRVVFDASCKTTSGFSLNDTLLIGPVVQQDLLSIVMRFRAHAIAITADVEKMYRQFLHHAQDKNFLRIRYRENSAEPISTYELQTVTYGTASAPFLATRTLKQIANDHGEQYPRAVSPVLYDFYVDDLLTGADDQTDAIEIVSQVTEMLQSAGLSLKKWASNTPEVLSRIPPEDVAILPTYELRDAQCVSTLGLVWEPALDLLRFRIDLPSTAPIWTRRITMSYIAKIFDPLGLLGPAITVAKLFMQQLWLLKQDGKAWDWDVELPSQVQKEWHKFYSTLHLLREIGTMCGSTGNTLIPEGQPILKHYYTIHGMLDRFHDRDTLVEFLTSTLETICGK
ncbi:uncharacterized protein LOC131285091 [Anopheles ziemanni]|uniref:uncharacterized protein LOC131263539 n=1 Tax=Anopheles coustani TaxID=139045 RepID=UPI00265AA51B|nr:uncharacterized protein LOC131263539 [Anopheles coustani]XP_058169932.1 uncharacterized protein LOC131285091 [Anopheles ziemanni]